MGDKTKIEWVRSEDGTLGSTWNPVRGCKKVSPGCDHCYAERFAERWRGIPGHPYEAGFDPRYVPDQLALPLRWKRPRMVFVNSQSDLFQGAFHNYVIDEVVSVMAVSAMHATKPTHTFQVLTKRSERAMRYATAPISELRRRIALCAGQLMQDGDRWYDDVSSRMPWPLPNVWLGVSIESRAYLSRMDDLRNTPAAVRFLSLEPLLEDLGTLDLSGIHWVIAGGESGPGCRPMMGDWVRSIRDQCSAAGVPFFFKQWGGLYKKRHGRILDGRTHDDMPRAS